MPSAIDPTKPFSGLTASKADLRNNLAAARTELEHGGFFTQGGAGTIERRTQDRLRELAVSVTDFGATGDGTTDDTAAFAAAFAAINAAGRPATLLVPPPPGGSYRLYSLDLQPAVPIAVVGERSTIKRLDNVTQVPGFTFSQGRMINIGNSDPGRADVHGYYPRVTFRGIVFDGNRQNQVLANGAAWPIDFSLEHHHAVSVEASGSHPHRQPVVFEDCDFRWTCGEGISVFRNASVHADACRFYACFRGGITVVGHHVEVVARDCVSDDPIESIHGMYSGFYFEYEVDGYEPRRTLVRIDGWRFRQGNVNVVTWGEDPFKGLPTAEDQHDYVLRGLIVERENRTGQVKLYNAGQSRMLVEGCLFHGGRGEAWYDNRTVVGGSNIDVVDTKFIASNGGLPASSPAPAWYAALRLKEINDNVHAFQAIRFRGCQFLIDPSCHAGAPVYAIRMETPGHMIRTQPVAFGFPPPWAKFEGCTFGYLKYYPNEDSTQPPVIRKFDWLWPKAAPGGLIAVVDCEGHAVNGFNIEGGQEGYAAYWTFAGGLYCVEGDLFRLVTRDPLETELVLRFERFLQEDRYNAISWDAGVQSEIARAQVWGGREIMVVSDPTAAGPVQITNRFLIDGLRGGGQYSGRLEGTPVVPGTLQIRNLDGTGTPTITDTDNGDGTGTLGGAGTGTITYATGWVSFRWTTAPAGNHRIVHSYRHGNEVPGFRGDVAVLKDDPAQRWRCTAANAAHASWQAL